MNLAETVSLPCGVTLKNRFAKAAMTEGIADPDDNATDAHVQLYRTWAAGGAGLLVTGNVMIDRRYLERPGNVVVDAKTDVAALERWAEASTSNDNAAIVQLSHPGRQCQRTTHSKPVAPSAVQLKLLGFFARPRALESDEITELTTRFASAAKTVTDAGFSGVQVHSAHGYLGSQFLSPRVNQRTDEWGGSLENRARFLLTTVDRVRESIGPDKILAVKLNSADFSKGGFSMEDSLQVAEWLVERGIDILEISGGTYESIRFIDGVDDDEKAASTKAREAYFLEYAQQVSSVMGDVALEVTGGFRNVAGMVDAVDGGEVDIVGVGRPFCVAPDFPERVFSGDLEELPAQERDLRFGTGFFGSGSSSAAMRSINSQAVTTWYYEQIYRLADGEEPDLSISARKAWMRHMIREQKVNRRRTSR